jgi:cytochrome c oxidase subunit I+III
MAVEVSGGAPAHLVIYPGNTALPIVMAAATGVFFLSFLLKVFWLAPIAIVGVAAFALRWAWTLGHREDREPEDAGRGILLPHAAEVDRSLGWWGSVFLLTANAVFFGSLLFGYAFLFTIAPGWPPPAWLAFSSVELVGGLGGAIAAVAGVRLAIQSNRRGASAWMGIGLSALGTLALLLATVSLMVRAPVPTGHAYGATLLVLGGYAAFHAALSLVMLGYLAARIMAGYVSPRRKAELAIGKLWVDYTSAVSATVVSVAQLPGSLS